MPQPIINRQQARELDRRASEEFRLPGVVLMENAGRGVADRLCQWGAYGPVVICCGAGNNGGDGLVIARHLDLRSIAVKVLLFAPPDKLRGDAAINYGAVAKSDIPLRVLEDAAGLDDQLAGAAWIVDALLGTGARGEPRPPLDAVIDRLNAHGAPIVAVDLPSGLDCDTGEASQHTIRATHTCTFVAVKPGFLQPTAQQYLGSVHVLDIGAPRKLVEEMLAWA